MNVKMEKKMKCVLILLLCCHVASPVKHSLKYFFTETPGAQSIPEFVVVAFVDEVQIGDSNSVREAKPKKDWIKFFEDHPQDLEWYRFQSNEIHHFFKATIETLRQRLNQTEGVHIFQLMYGCEWDDETKELGGYYQYGYDGEDFISLDLPTTHWTAAKQQAVITKQKWDTNGFAISEKNYVSTICPDWLKKYVSYGSSSLMRTVLPSVSLLQKTSSSPVTCHATGFHPNKAEMVWKKAGMELHEGVDKGEIITNNDGTFQMSVHLDVSSIKPEDWKKYDCVFQLSGMNEDIVTKLDKSKIKTNEKSYLIMIIAIVVVVVVLGAVIGFIVYKKKTSKCSQPPMKDPAVVKPLNPPTNA
ncbi:BOLA class I histocompatibility antigen, alpha chain BL3-7-like isoform X6 [Simochromis diagramma]|uniref:BOLA class I histocompatibility antigen, alpha chain BL3-7-like isoform X6 n=1 Tax=Simochromis diagramma TaxID=43689 RepID=UPI001A7F0C5B|nr:BOLA class I histocompatibility antigen, alpha chain BL3-7-like isoform X6 [Simochromis diagramma]